MQRRHGLCFAVMLLAAGCADDQGADDVDTSSTDPSSSSGPTSTVTPTTTITTDPSSSSDPSSSTDASSSGADSSSTSVDPDSSSGSGSSDSGSSDSGSSESSDSGSSDSGDSSTGEPVEIIVVINELSSDSNAEGGPDPIELYNASEVEADISGWVITDDISEPYDPEVDDSELVFPEGTTLFPGEFLLFYQADKGLAHPFGLSGSGDTVRLFDAELATIDTVTYGATEAAVSYCRMPDGPEGIWTPACTASFGASNG